MKFRTDFVTNSSDSSFLMFNIKNRRLFETLTSLGIKFHGAEDGEFTDEMEIELPSGATEMIEYDDGALEEFPSSFQTGSISAWFVSMILKEASYDMGTSLEGEGYDFTRELIDLLNKAGITHLDWEAVEEWSWENILSDLEKTFGAMDGDIEEAGIEFAIAYEGELGPALYTEVKDGKRLNVRFSIEDNVETNSCEGRTFVVTGRLKHYENRDDLTAYIEESGGTVTQNVTEDTDYLICNDMTTNSSKMKKAKELGISVLSETAFLRIFGGSDFEELEEEDWDEEQAREQIFDDDSGEGLLNFVMENGTGPIEMEVWKNGKWVRGGKKH